MCLGGAVSKQADISGGHDAGQPRPAAVPCRTIPPFLVRFPFEGSIGSYRKRRSGPHDGEMEAMGSLDFHLTSN